MTEYVALRNVRINGSDYRPGDAIDAGALTARQALILCDQRRIGLASMRQASADRAHKKAS